jgi:protein-S-isoprenylcysteine O-methyltransferase Ste14
MKLNLFQWLIAVAGFSLLAWHDRHLPWTPARAAGALLCVLAGTLVTAARYQLGRSFSIKAQARRLVTTGLYARFRNPIYVFAELFLIGLAVYLWSWWPLVVMLAAIPIQAARARNEAAVLEAAFGEAYRTYAAQTWF